jgi:hypothetical protein
MRLWFHLTRCAIFPLLTHAKLIFSKTGHATIDDSKTSIITAAELSENYLNLQDKKLIPHWSGAQLCFSVNCAQSFSS